jgi:uncharacterized protein (DUF4415 family)
MKPSSDLAAKVAAAQARAPRTAPQIKRAIAAYAAEYDPSDEGSIRSFLKRPFKTSSYAEMQGVLAVRRQAHALLEKRRGERGPQKAPTKLSITLRLDRDVIERFRAAGPGWQTRLNDALRELTKLLP